MKKIFLAKRFLKTFVFSWILVGFTSSLIFAVNTNVALTGTATQNTNYRSNTVASLANDNDTYAVWPNVAATRGNTPYDWWYLDLGAQYTINSINIIARSGCRTCEERLRNVRVMVSDTPFTLYTTVSSLNNALSNANWSGQFPSDFDNVSQNFSSINTTGRYVLIQKDGTYTTGDNRVLTLAEVQVWADTNTPPIVKDMNFSILQNTHVTFELNTTDDASNAIVSYPIFNAPTHGSLSGPESNLTYTPYANFTGIDSFSYKAYDGKNYSNEGTVTFHVYPPATAVHNDYNTTYNTMLNGNLLDNDLGLNIELIDFNTTKNGLLNINSDGSFTYLPNELFDGNDTFSYTIKDEFNTTSTTTVSIIVYPPRADLSIVKTAPSQSDVGLAIDYSLTIKSNPSTKYIPAKNVRVIDHLPNGVQYSGITAPTRWTCGQVGGTVTCDTSSLPIGYSGVIVIHAFAPNILGNSENTALVASDTIDPDLTNNTSSATTNVRGLNVDLGIVKSVSSPTVIKTDSFSYTLKIENLGTNDTREVTVVDNLDNMLGVININGGTDWSCGQGSSIVCTYIANGGVFAAGSSSNDIIINVRAPSIKGNITNTATVSSDTLELNTLNNSDSVDVNVTDGTIQNGSIPLTKYREDILYGDYTFIGNANINKPSSDADKFYNDYINMTFVDTDGDANTFNSTSSTLSIDNNYTIKWAGLYWEGTICSSDALGTSDGAGTGCRWENTPYANFNAATANIQNSLGTIQLKTPGNSIYTPIKATTLNTISPNILFNANNYIPSISWTYSAFADITSIVQNSGNGTYSVANIVLTEGSTYLGNYGGWMMLVVYEDPNHKLHYKDISIFNGFEYMRTDGNNVNISGFLTPHTGNINASLALFAADGDPANGGVGRMKVQNTSNYAEVTNASNPAGNLLNSTITNYGIDFNNVGKTYGVDADRMDVSTFLTNNQTDTVFQFDVTNPINTGQKDYYSVSMFAFATDLTSPALDIDHFDTTKLKLFKGTTTSSELSNADCGYDISDRRVSCKLPSVAINQSFTMQFTVNVKEFFDASIFDTNASNTAYAKYRNPNGNTYVARYTTPITQEAVGGKSNALNSGIFTSNHRNDDKHISIDAINTGYNYNVDRNITTKIVNQPFNIQLVHLDISGNYAPYQAWEGNKPMVVLVTLDNNGTVTPPLNNPNQTTFNQNEQNITIRGLNLTRAHRNKRLKLAYIDWNEVLSKAPSSSPCVQNLDQSVNLRGMPACFNTKQYMTDIFSESDFPSIAICYGTGVPSGRNYACDPLAYSTGGKANGNIYPAVYNHPFGCYQCITESFAYFRHNSTDNFAARPNNFVLTSTHKSFPDLLRSGKEYNLTLEAKDANGNNTIDYNTTSNTLRMNPPTLDPDKNISSNISLEGNATLVPTDTNISDGVSVDKDGEPADVVGFIFDNVGDVGINIYDPAWAMVDADDTPEECNATAQSIHNVPIEAVRSICGTVKMRFIPDHFSLTSTLVNHNDVGKFTYLSNDLNMSAHIRATLQAKNAKDEITTNFKKDAYENRVKVELNVTDWNTTLLGLRPTLRLDTNINIKDIRQAKYLGFGTDDDNNGTYSIDINTSNQIFFNYERKQNKPKNPFKINGSEANLTLTSQYSSKKKAKEGSATIGGTTLSTGGATFYYGRTEPKHILYDEVSEDNETTPIYITVYCDVSTTLNHSMCDSFGLNTNMSYFKEGQNKWWWALKHDMSNNDGNVTLKVTSANGIILPNSIRIPVGTGKENNVTVILGLSNATMPTRPAVVKIKLDTTTKKTTSSWLIYNAKYPAPAANPFESVRFIPKVEAGGIGAASNWTGLGQTGYVVDANASIKTNNQRVGW